MKKDLNKFVAISTILLFIILIIYFVYNVVDVFRVYKEKKNPTIVESKTDEKYVLAPLENDPIKGLKDAPVSIFIFSNYGVDNQNIYKIINTLFSKYGNKLNIVWKDFWESDDYDASSATIASRCANEQGKYWEFGSKLIEYKTLNNKTYQKISDDLHLDNNKFSSCIDSVKYGQDIYYNLHEADVLDIKKAPTIFINQQKISGDITLENLENVINALIK